MREGSLQNRLRIYLSKMGVINWRNNVGRGWAGAVQKITKRCNVSVGPGDVVIRNARPLHAGLCKGSSDVIGITQMIITQDMVGKSVGVFTAIEVKTPTGRVSAEQANYIKTISDLGGFAGIARCEDDLHRVLESNNLLSKKP